MRIILKRLGFNFTTFIQRIKTYDKECRLLQTKRKVLVASVQERAERLGQLRPRVHPDSTFARSEAQRRKREDERREVRCSPAKEAPASSASPPPPSSSSLFSELCSLPLQMQAESNSDTDTSKVDALEAEV